MPSVDHEQPYVMTAREIAAGYLHGHVETAPAPPGPTATIRDALEAVIRPSLLRPPCVVAFSGGRDSSLILAIAAHVARRDGLPLPVPVTRRFTNVPATDESTWQEKVVRHVGVPDWVRAEIEPGELDVVGPLARPHLRRFGVLWPPMIHADIPLLRHAQDGSLLDGEGGDEVLGTAAHRIAPLAAVLRSPRPLRRSRARSALLAVAPAQTRAGRTRRRWAGQPFPWMRPDAFQELVLDPLAEEEHIRPLSFSASVKRVPVRRTQVHMAANRRLMAESYGVQVSSPLLDRSVVDAIAVRGGFLGRGSRADVLRDIASDLLPTTVIERTTKAVFNQAYFGHHTRELARVWPGTGVEPSLVDIDELRRVWLTDHPPPMTWALAQAAWIGARRHDHDR